MKTNEQRGAKHSSSQLRITYPPHTPLLLLLLYPLPPSLGEILQSHTESPRHGNEKRKSVALFVLLSRHWQLIPQRQLAGGPWCHNTNAKTCSAWTLPMSLNLCQALFARYHLLIHSEPGSPFSV